MEETSFKMMLSEPEKILRERSPIFWFSEYIVLGVGTLSPRIAYDSLFPEGSSQVSLRKYTYICTVFLYGMVWYGTYLPRDIII